ncbi:MAG: hypothetical protein P9L99_03270 [Candidatus Lernaella stagnicola]|nr:hypothetical protein [Candidatus Lernaella stagnicola]
MKMFYIATICCLLATVAWAAEPGQVPLDTDPAADTTEPEKSARQASMSLGPNYLLLLDRDTRDIVGDLYGGMLSFRYHLLSWISASASVGYLGAYGKQEADVDYVSYRRVSTTSITPMEAGFHAEIRPEKRFNPYLGATAGGMYMAIQQDPENIRSNVPIYYDELRVTTHQWLPTAGGDVGFDVRITEWVGAYASGFYRWSATTTIRTELPGAQRKDELAFSHAGGAAGIWVYF